MTHYDPKYLKYCPIIKKYDLLIILNLVPKTPFLGKCDPETSRYFVLNETFKGSCNTIFIFITTNCLVLLLS